MSLIASPLHEALKKIRCCYPEAAVVANDVCTCDATPPKLEKKKVQGWTIKTRLASFSSSCVAFQMYHEPLQTFTKQELGNIHLQTNQMEK